MKNLIHKIIDFFLPAGTTRNKIAQIIYRDIIKKEKLKLITQHDYDKLFLQYRELYNNRSDAYSKTYEKSPLYVPLEESGFTLRNDDPKLIAFYLPQFHPIPENDKSFGKGFTEWTNTTRANPLFLNHYQPRLPDELGFYDTRLKCVLQRQIEIAKAYGIYGFCFHHYWFSGKPLLRVPYNHILSNPDLDMPFCLNWANESWTVRWDGFDTKNGVLLTQEHSAEDDMNFIKDIEPALRDKRYIRINGRPLLIIYRPGRFPDIKATVERWNDYTTKQGLGQLYLAAMQTNFEGRFNLQNDDIVWDSPEKYNFDAAIEFPHHGYIIPEIKKHMQLFYPEFSGQIFDYQHIMEKCLSLVKPQYTLFRGIMPDWDSTPRRKNPFIFINSSPGIYRKWLEGIIAYTKKNLHVDNQYIFINAWNEWAEGAYLEPDRKYGFAYLKATMDALITSRNH